MYTYKRGGPTLIILNIEVNVPQTDVSSLFIGLRGQEFIDCDDKIILHATYDRFHCDINVADQLTVDENIKDTNGTIAASFGKKHFYNAECTKNMC